MKIRLVLLLVICSSQFSAAQNWSGIIDPTRAVNWGNVGISGGIPVRNTVCTTLNPGATAAQINTALSGCSTGQVVFLNAGTYNLSVGIHIIAKSNVTLRGAGADQTKLVFTGSDSCSGLNSDICIQGDNSLFGGSSGLNPDNTATWTAASYAKGQTQITMSSTANLSVGKTILLDQCNDGLSGSGCSGTETDPGTIWVCDSVAAGCNDDGPSGGPTGAQRTGRDQQQLVTVTNIAGSVVTFSPGLYMPNWAAARSPGAMWATTQNAADGVENLSVDHTNSTTQAGIAIWNCNGCWVSGVRSITPLRSHVWIVISPRTVVRDNYFYGSQSTHSEGYGIEAYSSSDSLFENNIFQHMPSPQMINGTCSGCVAGYNYSINDFNDASFLFNSATLHAGGDDTTLFEGNIGNSYRGDLFHGSHNMNTAFRNYWNGWETGITGGLVALYLDPFSRYFNVIGNVLGRTGTHTIYQETPAGGSGTPIYIIGAGTVNISTGGDQKTVDTLMRWGNYDTVNAAVRFVSAEVPSGLALYANAVPASQVLPASFYLNAKPSWFPGTKAWPPIGPDVLSGNVSGVGGHANTIPAQDCYSAVMGGPVDGSGNALNFNAAACYTASGSPPNPPTGLTATVH